MDFDFRGERCGYKLFAKDLERGVGRATKDSTFDSATIQSSSFVDSENMQQKHERQLMSEPTMSPV